MLGWPRMLSQSGLRWLFGSDTENVGSRHRYPGDAFLSTKNGAAGTCGLKAHFALTKKMQTPSFPYIDIFAICMHFTLQNIP